ncbi:TPA: DUF3265 domain-containing protein [Vibrio vulnificus]|nr:DUF3265 domain-containing protein [Vibrio vulnificus]
MTKRLRGIWHAWHFRFALGSVIKSLCGNFCSACLHPLTRRYKLKRNYDQNLFRMWLYWFGQNYLF